MDFQAELEAIASGAFDEPLDNRDPRRVEACLQRGLRGLQDLALLLSPGAEPVLEVLARQARALIRRHFGHTVRLYAPLYVSDHCVNACTYCGFRAGNGHARSRLEEADIDREGKWLARAGFRDLLLVAGESRVHCSLDHLELASAILLRHVPLVGIEVYPLETAEYARLHRAGVEYLTLYQETYDRHIYREVHPRGPKADFDHRLEALERGCRGGMNAVGLGVLLGLAPWRRDVLALAAQGRWLERRYPSTRVGFSLPRLRQAAGMAPPRCPVPDRAFVQALLALRCWMPASDLTLSTRESSAMRDGLLPLVVTRLSAGSCTSVGGYGEARRPDPQFEISDERNLDEVCAAARTQGLNPVLADWVPLREETAHA